MKKCREMSKDKVSETLKFVFRQKMTYFDQIDPINDIFDQSYVNKPDWHKVFKVLE